eukprot:CAMPEP_0206445278 /NCGR_PEP_ID=MMETSP0324_2-20121206/15414_1 /ASSEMBLY_ACC=CAM_ASM_000836 /TAXON_ID=2866 /ORGANISM="Crypthecodinium cohnii, Strain Seligo" /LENGTH=478 /DNA_ID=CAMNT_0053913465 /DNA_START=99 /DNA_END=1535 /DNA_ORIENTATION=+
MRKDDSSGDDRPQLLVGRKPSIEMLRELIDGAEDDSSKGSDSDHSDGEGDRNELELEGGTKIVKLKRHPSVLRDGWIAYLKTSLYEMFASSKLSILLVATPLTIASKHLDWGAGYTFVLAIIALVPWGDRISWVTEDFVKYTNETAGGLFLASVGNLTEIVFCVTCLRGGLLRVVQVSMLGSVLSNMLLVLGCAFLVGGTKWDEQSFNKVAAVTNSGLLVIAVLALCLPSILDATHTGNGVPVSHRTVNLNVSMPSADGRSWLSGKGSLDNETEGGDAPLWLSRFIACVLVFLYGLLIYFQFVTHSHLFEDEDDDESPPILGSFGGAFWMLVITYFIYILSEYVVDALDEASTALHVPMLFLSSIVIPIVGNAVEHASAVCFAMHNKMEISLGVAIGSAVQISIFVIPLNVLAGWAMDKPMTLNFHVFETVILLLTTISVSFMISDGKSHWLKGAMLVSAYIMIGASFWAHAEPDSME